MTRSAAAGELVQLATFTVGTERYALDIMRIKEIINPLKITPVPRAPSFIEGVIELRGAILPVVDLRKRFELPATPQRRSTKYVIVGIDGRIVGLVVDGAAQVLRVFRSEIRPTPPMIDQAAFTGCVHVEGDIVMVLDIDRILSSDEKITLAGLGGGGA